MGVLLCLDHDRLGGGYRDDQPDLPCRIYRTGELVMVGIHGGEEGGVPYSRNQCWVVNPRPLCGVHIRLVLLIE